MTTKQQVHEIIKNKFIQIYKGCGLNLSTYKHINTGEYLTIYNQDTTRYWVGKNTINMYDLNANEFIKRFT